MIKLVVSESAEKLRLEFRKWLAKNPAPKVTSDSSLQSFVEVGRNWQKTLAAENWVGVHWPLEFGGKVCR
jgi:hypothetical protein